MKDILPQTPKKKAAILKKLTESPSTSKVIFSQGLSLTPACKEKLQVAVAMVELIKESISEVKSRIEKQHVYNVIAG